MNFNTIKQELNKKIKRMSEDDFKNFITELKRIYYKRVFKDEGDRFCSIFTCSLCGEQITLFNDTLKNSQEGHYNFCPNCGKRMESEKV